MNRPRSPSSTEHVDEPPPKRRADPELNLLDLFAQLPLIAVLPCLTDGDVMSRLLLLCKSIKPEMKKSDYHLQGRVGCKLARDLGNMYRYFPCRVRRLLMTDTNCRWMETVTDVICGDHFNEPLPVGSIPSSVTDLNLGKRYNQPLMPGSLPPALQKLNLGDQFNKPLATGVIPPQVATLVFGDTYNHPLNVGVIPSSVTDLTIGRAFEESLDKDVIPISVQSLSIRGCKLKSIIIPPSVKQVKVHDIRLLNAISRFIPGTVETMRVDRSWRPSRDSIKPGMISQGVSTLFVGNPIDPNALPSSLTSIHFMDGFNSEIQHDSLPEGIVRLSFGSSFNKPLLPGVLPSSLKTLKFGDAFNQFIRVGVIPDGIETIQFGEAFNQPLTLDTLPQSTRYLHFGYHFNQPLEHHVRIQCLPVAYREILADQTDDMILVSLLPPDLLELTVSDNIMFPIPKHCLRRDVKLSELV